jgi:hypothetical protein
MDDLDLSDFGTFFYRSPAPERASEAIRWYAATPLIEDPIAWVPVAYFFARMAQMYPEIVEEYEDLVPQVRAEAKPFIRGILKDLQSTPPGPIDALDRPIRSGTDIDLLWSEFVLTGSNEPILRIIALLERPDKVREKLEVWLAAPKPSFARLLGFDRRRQRSGENLRAVAGIVCDPHRKRIETTGDLDCRCLMQGVHIATPDYFARIRRVLPFDLSRKEVTDMGIKATAKWILASNVNRHPTVLVACEEELARRTGNVEAALQEIVEFYRQNSEDHAEAMNLQQAAERGDAEAEYKLGMMHYHGQGVEKDTFKAEKWVRRAAEQGLAQAQVQLGNMHIMGDGAAQDVVEAMSWFRKAAEQGSSDGQSFLGRVYLHGKGVPKDYVKAHLWLSMAAANGDESSERWLNALVKQMTADQIAEAQRLAREWLDQHEQ